MEPARIRVARCRDNAEAALVRAMLAAHGIDVVISGEQHAAMLGGLAGPFLSLDVWCDREDAEAAAELIDQLREGAPEPELPLSEDDSGPVQHWGIELRRRTGIVLLLACVITFGTGHLYARAWGRFVILAAIEGFGLWQVGVGHDQLGAALIAFAVLTDLIGGVIRVRRAVAAERLPAARVH